MSALQSSGWQQFGKADKATCSWIISRLPDDIRLALNKSEREVLEWLLFFTWKGATQGKGSPTSTFLSQIWVAEAIGKSRWTIGRALDALEESGLIGCLKRLKDRGGNWKPRLKTIKGRLAAFLAYLSGKSKPNSPWGKNAPHEVKKRNKGGGLDSSSKESESIHPKKGAPSDELSRFMEEWTAKNKR